MQQIILNIPDNKYKFFLELIKNFNFVKVKEDEYIEPTKEEILEGLKDAFNEVRLHQEGKIKLKPAKDLLNEL
ncbi:MAG: hypothetical protein KAT68_18595 [Bacteroidales bacterium]|nr:hypothetical protein [Bacteroidales bacterium]